MRLLVSNINQGLDNNPHK